MDRVFAVKLYMYANMWISIVQWQIRLEYDNICIDKGPVTIIDGASCRSSYRRNTIACMVQVQDPCLSLPGLVV